MKLKPTRRKVVVEPEVETHKVSKPKKPNRLPSDEYQPLFEPKRFLVRETVSSRDSSPIKQYFEVQVRRFDNDDELGLPHICIQMYQESEFYTGYLKGKSIYLPLESGEKFIKELEILIEKSKEKGLI